jgi:hypothetical protein
VLYFLVCTVIGCLVVEHLLDVTLEPPLRQRPAASVAKPALDSSSKEADPQQLQDARAEIFLAVALLRPCGVCCCSPRLQLSLLTLSLSRPRTGGGRRQRPEWRRKYFQWPAPERRHGRTNALISLLLKLTVLTQITRMALYRQPNTLRSTKLRPLCTHALTTRPLTALTALTTSYACTNTRHSRPLPTCTPSLTDTISVTRHSLHAAN